MNASVLTEMSDVAIKDVGLFIRLLRGRWKERSLVNTLNATVSGILRWSRSSRGIHGVTNSVTVAQGMVCYVAAKHAMIRVTKAAAKIYLL